MKHKAEADPGLYQIWARHSFARWVEVTDGRTRGTGRDWRSWEEARREAWVELLEKLVHAR